MKKVLVVLFCLILSGLIVFGWPKVVKTNEIKSDEFNNEISLIAQKTLSYDTEENAYHKLYQNGKLIGVIKDMGKIEQAMEKQYVNYQEMFPNGKLGLINNVYITEDKAYNNFEDIDDQIVEYMLKNEFFGIQTNAVEFSTEQGIYDIIYVDNIQDFYDARDMFLTNFISKETLDMLRANQTIDDITSFGTIETNIKIKENISYSSAIVSPSDIFTDVNQIYEYLCYGRNTERQYYSIQEGDTLAGIGYFYGNLSPAQIVSLNKGVLNDADEVLKVGTTINVTYFTSPITVSVTKKRLAQETITPPKPEYKEDKSLSAGKTEVIQAELVGLKNVLYEEIWDNGVLQSGSELSSVTIREPIKGIIKLGVGADFRVGTGNFMWPTDQAHLNCGWECYPGHNGNDIGSRYNVWGNIYAADAGTVEKVGYDPISGNNCTINHNNGYKTYYGHMNKPPFVSVGQAVERGQLIGQIGMTGVATGPHIHFMIYVDGVVTDACKIMDCSLIR